MTTVARWPAWTNLRAVKLNNGDFEGYLLFVQPYCRPCEQQSRQTHFTGRRESAYCQRKKLAGQRQDGFWCFS